MARKVYDRYLIDCPSEAFGDETTRLDVAIDIARENARLYVIPCTWTATAVDDNTVKVIRIRNGS